MIKKTLFIIILGLLLNVISSEELKKNIHFGTKYSEKSLTYYENGQYEKCINELENEEKSWGNFRIKGLCYKAIFNYKKAIECFKKGLLQKNVIKEEVIWQKLYLNLDLIRSHIHIYDLAKAKELICKMNEEIPEVDLNSLRGDIKWQEGKINDAKKLYFKYTSNTLINYKVVYKFIHTICTLNPEKNDANEVIEWSSLINNSEQKKLKLVVLFYKKDYNKVIEMFRKEPTLYSNEFFFAIISYYKLNLVDKANELYRKILIKNNRIVSINWFKARFYFKYHKKDLKIIEKVIKNNQSYIDSLNIKDDLIKLVD